MLSCRTDVQYRLLFTTSKDFGLQRQIRTLHNSVGMGKISQYYNFNRAQKNEGRLPGIHNQNSVSFVGNQKHLQKIGGTSSLRKLFLIGHHFSSCGNHFCSVCHWRITSLTRKFPMSSQSRNNVFVTRS